MQNSALRLGKYIYMDKQTLSRLLVIASTLKNRNVTLLALERQPVGPDNIANSIVKDILCPEGWKEIHEEVKNIANKVREEKKSVQDLNNEESAEVGIPPFTLEDIYKIEEWFDANAGVKLVPERRSEYKEKS